MKDKPNEVMDHKKKYIVEEQHTFMEMHFNTVMTNDIRMCRKC